MGVTMMSNFPKNLTNVALYLRKSRADFEAESRGEGETLNRHRSALLALAEKYCYAIKDTYEEIVSGERILDRPEMHRLLQAVHHGQYPAVLCMDLDRLGRGNMVDQGLIQEAFKATNTLIITPRKVYDLQDELDEEWSEFEAFMARRELKIITRRLQRGRRQSVGLGKSISKQPPYGYLRDSSLMLHPNPETAPVVRMIFSQASAGFGMTRIANHLTTLGIPTPSGKQTWQRSSIYAILKNPAYLGKIVWGRVKHTKNPTAASSYKRIRQNPEDWLVSEDAHEPLVDSETYERYIRRLEKVPKVSDKKELANPLASLLYCSECGKALSRQQTYNRPSNRLLCKTFGCSTKSASFELVESRVLLELQKILHDMVIQTEASRARHHFDYESMLRVAEHQIQHANETIVGMQKQRTRLHDLLEQQVYDVETFLERNRVLEQQVKAAQELLTVAQAEVAQVELQNERYAGPLPQLVNVIETYDMAQSVSEKNQLLRSIVERISFTRKREWKKPDYFELEITLCF